LDFDAVLIFRLVGYSYTCIVWNPTSVSRVLDAQGFPGEICRKPLGDFKVVQILVAVVRIHGLRGILSWDLKLTLDVFGSIDAFVSRNSNFKKALPKVEIPVERLVAKIQ